MKIVQPSYDRLELRDPNVVYFLFGIFFLVIGCGGVVAFFVTPESNSNATSDTGEIGAAAFAAAGFYLTFLSGMRKTVFDKAAGLMTLKKSALIGKDAKEYQLIDVGRIKMKEQIKDPGGIATSIGYHLAVVLKSGEEIPLSATVFQSHVLFGVSKLDQARTHGEQIATFLGVPFDDDKVTLAKDELVTFADQDVQSVLQGMLTK